jgi:hypothetical protein
LRSPFAENGLPKVTPNIALGVSQSTEPGAGINLKLSHTAHAGLLAASMFFLMSFCPAQSAPETQTLDPVQSAQPPATAVAKPEQPDGQSSAQSNPQEPNSPVPQVTPQDTKKKDDRMFYVMPNYLTVDGESQATPISWKEKFAITAKGAFDPYEFAIVGVVASIRQANNSYPAFGQGTKGFAKRYGTAFADQVDGNLMVGGLFPSILKTDPRYFRLGQGRVAHRFGYALSRVLVARKDSGERTFNISEFAGNATAIAISNVYYPAADRGFSSSFSGFTLQIGIDAFGNELKEFWPDIHGYLQRRHARQQKISTD